MLTVPRGLVEALRQAERVTVLTGAGVSAESGVPTFRDAQTGFWAQFNPQELATPDAFRQNPKLVWEWYTWRRELIGAAAPNPAHEALAKMEHKIPRFTLVTQNIDDLHRIAGSQRVIELHGNIQRSKCLEEEVVVAEWAETEEVPPRCPRCDGLLRPDVVWFGEALPGEALAEAVQATRNCDLFFTIGTSALVHPAAALPYEAVEQGAVTVEINPDSTPVTAWMDYVLQGPAGEVLPALLDAAWPEGSPAR